MKFCVGVKTVKHHFANARLFVAFEATNDFLKKDIKYFFKLENDNFYSVFVCYELKAIVAIFGLVDEEENSISSIINEPLPPSNSYIFVVIF